MICGTTGLWLLCRCWLPEDREGFSCQDGRSSSSPLSVRAIPRVPGTMPPKACGQVLECWDFWCEFVVLLEQEYLGWELQCMDERFSAPPGVDGHDGMWVVRAE